jgi:hypothetical protein
MSENDKADKIREAILIWCDGIDAVTTQLRKSLDAQGFKQAQMPPAAKPAEIPQPAAKSDPTALPYDLAKINSEEVTRENKTKYRRATKAANMDNQDYANLWAMLKQAGGSLTTQEQYVWLYTNDETIGWQPAKETRRRKQ